MSKKRYDPRVPRPANGFRAQSLRALPRGAWWAKRWIQAIEQMRLGARAGRGRVYAEQGQVTALTIAGSHVEATVLGARPDPYTVKIDFKGIAGRRGGKASKDILHSFGAMTAGRILAGEMPIEVEELFAAAGVSPYPSLGQDSFWCSCPDWSKPCKHIAAVLYLIGDALVRSPSLLLTLREERKKGDLDPVPLWRGRVRLLDGIESIRRRIGGIAE